MSLNAYQQNTGNKKYAYDAFIEYQNTEPDRTIARKLYEALTTYRVPKNIESRERKTKLQGIYMETGGFSSYTGIDDGIREALGLSRFLIIICSPCTPGSARTLEMIDYFRETHANNNILTLLISGEPHESFPSALMEVKRRIQSEETGLLIDTVETVEPLAGDIRAAQTGEALKLLKIEKLRLIAPILGYNFDDLRQRYRERALHKMRAIFAGVIAAALVLGSFGFFEWQYAETQRRNAQTARDETVRKKEIAKKQADMSMNAYVRIMNLAEEFYNIPEAAGIVTDIQDSYINITDSKTGEKIRFSEFTKTDKK